MNREPESLERVGDTVNGDPEEWRWSRLTALVRDLRGASATTYPLEPLARFAVSELGAGQAIALDGMGDELRSVGAAGLESSQDRGRILAYARRLAVWVQKTKLPVAVNDPAKDERFGEPPSGATEAMALPLGWNEDVRGALAIFFTGSHPGEDDAAGRDDALAFLSLLAALVLDRGHSRRRGSELLRKLEESERLRIRAEQAAWAGELMAEMIQEVKAPLASLGGLASQLADSMPEDDPRRPMLEVLEREVGRLDRMLGDQLELTRAPVAELGPDDLNRLLEESVLLLAPDLESNRVRITKKLGRDIPPLLLDTQLMRRVFLNMLRTGIERSGSGGKIRVESKRRGKTVEALIAADGSRERGDVVELLWRPFQADGSRPGDITSAAVERILKQHRGTLRVSSNREWALIFSLQLPIPGNRERRRSADRRRRPRRRA